MDSEPVPRLTSRTGVRRRSASRTDTADSGAAGASWLKLETGDPGTTNTAGLITVGAVSLRATGKQVEPVDRQASCVSVEAGSLEEGGV